MHQLLPQTTHQAQGRTGPGMCVRPGQPLLSWLLESGVLLHEDWDALPEAYQQEFEAAVDSKTLLEGLMDRGLLTEYQSRRVATGQTFGLVLGNYRVLERLGGGTMGVVYRAEHMRMRRTAAIKALSLSVNLRTPTLPRFLGEIRAVSRLQHANTVAAIDCGELANPDCPNELLHYFVMDFVPGEDLEQYVLNRGPLAASRACEIVYQVAAALDEAHKQQLVHRDVKPSNVRVTPAGQVKLLDFGLALHFHHRLTEHGTVLGTVDYMAPEQARDPSSVDIRADVYGLGGLLCWCLTGEPPFPTRGSATQALAARLTQPAPSVRKKRPELSPELDLIVARMMAIYPGDRYPDPRGVMRALQAFLNANASPRSAPLLSAAAGATVEVLSPTAVPCAGRVRRILIVDDEPHLRSICRLALYSSELAFEEACDGAHAVQALYAAPFDLVLLDVDMPAMKGPEVLKRLRSDPPSPHLKVIMFSGRASGDDMAELLLAGADDYVTKPFSNFQLQARVRAALRLKDVQERGDLLNRHLLAVNAELEHTLNVRDGDLIQARNGLVLALAKLAEQRDNDTGTHLLRLQCFSRCLAEEASVHPNFLQRIDGNFIQLLECCAPLHDIGKVGLPDHILLKPGKLTPEERLIMQTHTTIGADTLAEVSRQYGFARAFLQMAIDIARHHHERWDGTGYPDRLTGEAIPLAARVVALADVYDALRSRRVYKPGLSHASAVGVMASSEGQFDPSLLQAFHRCAERMEQIYSKLTA